VEVIFARWEDDDHLHGHQHRDLPWWVVLCVVWRHPGESRSHDCTIAVSATVLVNNPMSCSANISHQFLLMANIWAAIIVVFVDVCLLVDKKADFLFNCKAKGPYNYHSCNFVNIRNYSSPKLLMALYWQLLLYEFSGICNIYCVLKIYFEWLSTCRYY
jgi:hypothetical protein